MNEQLPPALEVLRQNLLPGIPKDWLFRSRGVGDAAAVGQTWRLVVTSLDHSLNDFAEIWDANGMLYIQGKGVAAPDELTLSDPTVVIKCLTVLWSIQQRFHRAEYQSHLIQYRHRIDKLENELQHEMDRNRRDMGPPRQRYSRPDLR